MYRIVRLEAAGKLGQAQAVAEACAVQPSHRLSVTDSNTGLRFLIDTGANISVLPFKNKCNSNESSDYKLYAANGTEIKTYGIKTLE